MKILKKKINNAKSERLLVDNIEEPTFIYYDKPGMQYDYRNKLFKPFHNYKREIELIESPYTYVIWLKFRVCSVNSGKHIVIEEKCNRDDYLYDYGYGLNLQTSAMPKFSVIDFIEFMKEYQTGGIRFEDGYFECALEIVKKTDQYFVKLYKEK